MREFDLGWGKGKAEERNPVLPHKMAQPAWSAPTDTVLPEEYLIPRLGKCDGKERHGPFASPLPSASPLTLQEA